LNSASPSFSEIELTMPLPWMHFRPASITSHFDESIMIGTRAISGSPAIRLRKRTIAALLSSMASSMLMSMTCAPFSTCWRATLSAPSKSPARISRAKAFEPVTLVRSPMLTNSEPSPISTGSRPDNFIGGTVAAVFIGFGPHRGAAALTATGSGRVSAVDDESAQAWRPCNHGPSQRSLGGCEF
jgi:hypothetical protein